MRMEQKDYLLREIEKIGLLLRSILNSLSGRKENLAITIENHFEETKEMLFNEIGFEFDKFLTLNESASKDYLSQIKGINPENIEILAEIFYRIGVNWNLDKKSIFLEKALLLYEICNISDKTFSFIREAKIEEIKNAL